MSDGNEGDSLDSVERELRAMLTSAAPPRRSVIGETIAETYTVEEPLAEGGMGEVFLARHQRTGGRVALKLIKTSRLGDEKAVRRFELEAQHTASLHHANIVRVFDYGHDDDLVYLAMEYVPGRSLQQMLESDGVIPWQKALSIASQVLKALAAAHESERQIVHRDIKPGNILVTEDGDDVFVKVLDFGIARALEGPSANTQGVIGSPQTMAPEQFDGGDIGPWTDLYALGCTMYGMLSGSPPFSGTYPELAKKHCDERPAPLELPEDAPRGLVGWVSWLMKKKPTDRPQSAQAALAGLRSIDSAWPSETIEASPAPRRTPILGVATGLVALVTVTVFFGVQSKDVAPPPPQPTSSKEPQAAETAAVIDDRQLNIPAGGQISPDGEQVAYVKPAGAEVIRLDGQPPSLHPMQEGAELRSVAWYPDSQHLLGCIVEGEQVALWKLPLGGNGEPTLVLTGGCFAQVSPDGKRIAYLGSVANGAPPPLLIADIDGANPHKIASAAETLNGWLSDSSAVTFMEVVGRSYRTKIGNEKTSQTILAEEDFATGGGTVFVPISDRRVLFKRATRTPQGDWVSTLWTAVIDDDLRPLEPVQVPHAEGLDYGGTSWSHDTNKLLYCRATAERGLRVAAIDESGDVGESRSFASTSRTENYPAWSADGERVLFGSNRSGPWRVYEQALESNEARPLTELDGWTSRPSAGPADELLFMHQMPGEQELSGATLFVQSGNESKPLVESLTKPEQITAVFGSAAPDAAVLCTPDGSPSCVIHRAESLRREFLALNLETGRTDSMFDVVESNRHYAHPDAWALRAEEPRLAVATEGGIELRTATGKIAKRIETKLMISALDFARDGQGLFITGWDPEIGIFLGRLDWDGEFDSVERQADGYFTSVKASPTGEHLLWYRYVTSCLPWTFALPD